MFVLTVAAYDDLKDIAAYTQETWGENQCDLYLKMIDDAFHELSDNPAHGTKIDDIRAGYYKYRIAKHLIFYRHIADYIEIVRILHQSMDTESHL